MNSLKRTLNIGTLSLATIALCLGVAPAMGATAATTNSAKHHVALHTKTAVKKKTIICYKGTAVRHVKAVKPHCPAGWTTKKPASVPADLKAALVEPTMATVAKQEHITALPSPAPTGKNLYYIYAGLGSGQIIQAAFTAAAAAIGWNFHVLTYSSANPASIQPLFLQAINAGANGIAYDGIDVTQISTALALAKTDNIPIITHFSADAETAANNALFTQHFNNQIDTPAIGKIAGEEIEQVVGNNSHVVVVGTNGITTVDVIDQLYQSSIKTGCGQCSVDILNLPVADFGSANDNADIISYLRLNPKTNFVFFSYGLSESNLRSALNNAGFSKVRIGGNSANPSNNAELVYGADSFWIQEPYWYVAWLDVNSFAESMEGGNIAAQSTFAYPVWLTTKGHIKFNVTTTPIWPLGMEKTFLTDWHVAS